MKVRTIKEHANSHGDKWYKEIGKTYDAPDDVAERLIDGGFAESAEPSKAKRKK